VQIDHASRWRLAKWFGLFFELYFLFLFVNVALLVPYPYDWKRVLLVIAGGLITGLCAFFSSLGIVELSKEKTGTKLKVVAAFPFLVWGAITAITCLILIVGSLA
jgi:hypothetical protein